MSNQPPETISTPAVGRPASRGAPMSRRAVAQLIAGASVGAALSAPALAQARPRLVVVGGGAAGATIARYVAKDSPRTQVTLINDSATYTTCFFSNLYLVGWRSLGSLTHRYDLLVRRHDVEFVRGRVASVDLARREVALADGGRAGYDRLVLAPGVSFTPNAVRGYDPLASQAMPHAYHAGYQTFLLRRQLLAMRPGGLFVLAAPPNPYRCPPGPYERVSVIARLFKRINPRAKILVLDAKDRFAKQSVFQEAWDRIYPGMIEWRPASLTSGGVVEVSPSDMTLFTGDGEAIKADVASVIPPQRAGEIAVTSGLTDSGDWAPVDSATMRSLVDPNVFVVGDAARATPLPKSGYAANSAARVAANAIRADLDDTPLFPARYANTCWSFVDDQNVIKIGANYQVDNGEIRPTSRFTSQIGETEEVRFNNTLEVNAWYSAIAADMFS